MEDASVHSECAGGGGRNLGRTVSFALGRLSGAMGVRSVWPRQTADESCGWRGGSGGSAVTVRGLGDSWRTAGRDEEGHVWGWTRVPGLVTPAGTCEHFLACARAGTRPSQVRGRPACQSTRHPCRAAWRPPVGRLVAVAVEASPGTSWQVKSTTEWPAGVHCACPPVLCKETLGPPGPPPTGPSRSLADTGGLGGLCSAWQACAPVFYLPVCPPTAVCCWEHTSLHAHGRQQLLHSRTLGLLGMLGTVCRAPQTLCSQPGSAGGWRPALPSHQPAGSERCPGQPATKHGSAGHVPSVKRHAARPCHEPGLQGAADPPPAVSSGRQCLLEVFGGLGSVSDLE